MQNINLYYWDGAPNFGDQLNIDICKKIFKVNPICTLPEECEAAFVGSLLDDFLCVSKENESYVRYYDTMPPVKIWGAGFITGKNKYKHMKRPFYKPEFYFRKISLHAVRGKKSLKRLEHIFKTKFPACVVGDPGLLVSELSDLSQVKKNYRIGIIPHHIEKDDSVYKNLLIKNSKIIDIEAPIDDVLHNIAECNVIASASLHGLIAADSLGIPNGRLIASNKIMGGSYKFTDYYTSLNIQKVEIDLRECAFTEKHVQLIADNYCLLPKVVSDKKQELINSFPY